MQLYIISKPQYLLQNDCIWFLSKEFLSNKQECTNTPLPTQRFELS
ncbi:hypothetical protein GBAR_LOCUS967 [Geodia barretti]|uniref:Uncharacterized protein n=1 Tax=Geodia barretti TaxID=519541 RepID=A0AA35QVJ1_GEOBA|nr:hypothetical protein GBAR_LOCUS967 [Geodia barretti]